MQRRLSVILISTLVGLVATAIPASAAEAFRVSDVTPGKGQLFTMSGSGCIPNTIVSGRLDEVAFVFRSADGEGDFSVSFRIPFTVSLSGHVASIRCRRAYPAGSYFRPSRTVTVHGGLTARPTSIARGGVTRVSGAGCRAYEFVVFRLDSMTLRTSSAGSGGKFSVDVRIPRTASRGYHLLRAICGRLDQAERVRVT